MCCELKHLSHVMLIHRMNSWINNVQDDATANLRLYVVDPLSIIVKLGILSNKPIGTKIRIANNVMHIQEPGPFQGLCRFVLKSNKTEIHHLHNPVYLACKTYLTKPMLSSHPKLKDLFVSAQRGLTRLKETYKQCSIVHICLSHYHCIIENFLTGSENVLFQADNMTPFYMPELMERIQSVAWTSDKIKIVLNLTSFLSNDTDACANVQSLETILRGIDGQVSGFF